MQKHIFSRTSSFHGAIVDKRVNAEFFSELHGVFSWTVEPVRNQTYEAGQADQNGAVGHPPGFVARLAQVGEGQCSANHANIAR